MIRISANLFRIANLSVSTEETRYYLNGVFVEPHHSRGVTLTATDGHRLLHIHDEAGVCDKPAIIKLSKEALAACKRGKSDPLYSERYVVVDQASETASVEIGSHDGEQYHQLAPVAVTAKCVVDGTFPDYRRVVPSGVATGNEKGTPAFDQAYVGEFCDIAKQLGGPDKNTKPGILIKAGDAGDPALVFFPAAPHAFGVIMPYRKPDGFEAALPAWFRFNFAKAA